MSLIKRANHVIPAKAATVVAEKPAIVRRVAPLQTSAKTVEAAPAPATVTPEAIAKAVETTVNTVIVQKAIPQETTITVQRSVLVDSVEKENSETVENLDVKVFATEPARVSYTASVKKTDGNYGNVAVSVTLTAPCYVEEVASVFDAVRTFVHQKIDAEAELLGVNDEEPVYERTEDATPAAELDDEPVAEEEAEITPAEINKMPKAELIKLIKDNQLDIDTTQGVKELRTALIAVVTDSGDDVPAEVKEELIKEAATNDSTEEEEGADITEDDVLAMTQDELVNLVEEHALPISVELSEAELRKAIIAYMQEGEDSLPTEESAAPAEVEAVGDEEEAFITREELEAYAINDLKALAQENGIKVVVKASDPAAAVKEAYIKAVLDYQNSYAA